MATKASRKIRSTPEQRRAKEKEQLVRRILPAGRPANDFEMVDVANHSEGDQRHMNRSGERRTLRRKSSLDYLLHRGIIDRPQLLACEWYAEVHAKGYDTLGLISQYGEGGAGGRLSFSHLAKCEVQRVARQDYEFARSKISPFLLPPFERVVLHGRPQRKLDISFREAAKQLLNAIDGRVIFEAKN